MNSVFLKQIKPQQVMIFGYVLLVLTPALWYFNENAIEKIVFLLVVGLMLVGYSVHYEITKEYKNFKRIKVYGVTVWKQQLELLFPDYISVFSAPFKKDNEWGAVAALGTKSEFENVVIKFFKGHKNVIVYRSNNYLTTLEKADRLSRLLDVRVHDAIKNSST